MEWLMRMGKKQQREKETNKQNKKIERKRKEGQSEKLLHSQKYTEKKTSESK
jgi:hypothetical protein